ncbi:class I histocompatibility antigen, F10 alpha chain-like [Engystomops pustulosus]|uniref:class I histocompatibility antigen, F10 alpha chain-like n=1 Tax=Engystomops pustulosus TaxID=76066 RepID=UPI003AFA4CEF
MRKMYPLIVLLLHLSASYCDSHSMRYYMTVVSAPGSGLSEFSTVGYVDDREIVNYNSDSRILQPKVQWMEKVEAEYWERNTQRERGNEAVFRNNVKIAMARFNQTGGFHILQLMHGCELGDDGSVTGYDQYGYDGGEFISLDTKTWTYIPTMSQAQITAQRWNSPELQAGEREKIYMENECIDWLREHVENGREDLERRVQPKVKVSGQESDDGILTLHCLAHGFHPRAVDVKWMKNMVDDIPTYETTHVLPNPDGTYQIRVSVDVRPKEGDTYSCYVDHSSLTEPLHIVWEPNKPRVWVLPLAIAVVVALLGAGAVAGFLWCRKKKDGYKATGNSEPTPDLSNNLARA